jgi:transposase
VTGANTNDSLMFEALLGDIPSVRTPAGQRRCRPDKVHADKAHDHRRCRGYLTRRGIKVRIARCGIESSQRLGRHRWKAERTIAWLVGCRRLRVRYDRDSERFFAFVDAGLRPAARQPAALRGHRPVTMIPVWDLACPPQPSASLTWRCVVAAAMNRSADKGAARTPK